jgi:small neutral amino acid transporter SnatA (MarC family)
MSQNQLVGAVPLLIGLLLLAGGALGWSWLLRSRRARTLVSLIGRTGARIFYVIIGLLLSILGILTLAGVVVP